MRARRISIGVLTALLAAGVMAVVAYAATNGTSWHAHWGTMGKRYAYQPAKATPIHTLDEARIEAQKFAARLNLRVDEVLQFKRNFYAKLVDSGGNGATEVLVDPASGVVSIEYGPAMMWNTKYGMVTRRGGPNMMGRYGTSMMGGVGRGMMRGSGNGYGTGMMGGSGGMMGGSGGMMGGGYGYGGSGGAGSATTNVSLAQAHALAQRWLQTNESGVTVETGGDTFPGYYTMETLKSGTITGMISVNATTGIVWPHWWHGTFVAKSG